MPTPASQRPNDRTDNQLSERRWSERRSCAMSVTLEADGETWEGTIRNLGIEGMFVALDRLPHPRVTRFEATAIDPGQRHCVAVVVEVAHRQAQGIGLRLHLTGRTAFRVWRDLWWSADPTSDPARPDSGEPEISQSA